MYRNEQTEIYLEMQRAQNRQDSLKENEHVTRHHQTSICYKVKVIEKAGSNNKSTHTRSFEL